MFDVAPLADPMNKDLVTHPKLWHLPCSQIFDQHAVQIAQGPLPAALLYKKSNKFLTS